MATMVDRLRFFQKELNGLNLRADDVKREEAAKAARDRDRILQDFKAEKFLHIEAEDKRNTARWLMDERQCGQEAMDIMPEREREKKIVKGLKEQISRVKQEIESQLMEATTFYEETLRLQSDGVREVDQAMARARAEEFSDHIDYMRDDFGGNTEQCEAAKELLDQLRADGHDHMRELQELTDQRKQFDGKRSMLQEQFDKLSSEESKLEADRRREEAIFAKLDEQICIEKELLGA